MNFAAVEAVANALLYEGYLLYPYRPGALKNHLRWMFGVLSPRGAGFQSEWLVAGGASSVIEGRLRFLLPTEPDALPCSFDFGPVGLEDLVISSRRWTFSGLGIGPMTSCPSEAPPPRSPSLSLSPTRGERIPVPPAPECEALFPVAGGQPPPAALAMTGAMAVVELSAALAAPDIHRLTLRVRNETPLDSTGPEPLPALSMVSTQVIMSVEGGQFVPPRDPPEHLREAADACRNTGLWPIMMGEPGTTRLVLCSPIILDDYPHIAPESPGDFFDSTEIDELLSLRILTLTPEEKRAMAEGGARAAAVLARTEALGLEQLGQLHGAVRWHGGGSPALKPGDSVRLRPRGGSDIFDLALDGMTATVESLERDFDGRDYVAVSIDDDPGKDLGASGQPGHRFFFAPDEVELRRQAEGAS